MHAHTQYGIPYMEVWEELVHKHMTAIGSVQCRRIAAFSALMMHISILRCKYVARSAEDLLHWAMYSIHDPMWVPVV